MILQLEHLISRRAQEPLSITLQICNTVFEFPKWSLFSQQYKYQNVKRKLGRLLGGASWATAQGPFLLYIPGFLYSLERPQLFYIFKNIIFLLTR